MFSLRYNTAWCYIRNRNFFVIRTLLQDYYVLQGVIVELARNIYSTPSSAAYRRQWIGEALVQIMACRLFGAKPLSESILGYCRPLGTNINEILMNIPNFSVTKMHLRMSCAIWRPFWEGGDELTARPMLLYWHLMTIIIWAIFQQNGKDVFPYPVTTKRYISEGSSSLICLYKIKLNFDRFILWRVRNT